MQPQTGLLHFVKKDSSELHLGMAPGELHLKATPGPLYRDQRSWTEFDDRSASTSVTNDSVGATR